MRSERSELPPWHWISSSARCYLKGQGSFRKRQLRFRTPRPGGDSTVLAALARWAFALSLLHDPALCPLHDTAHPCHRSRVCRLRGNGRLSSKPASGIVAKSPLWPNGGFKWPETQPFYPPPQSQPKAPSLHFRQSIRLSMRPGN